MKCLCVLLVAAAWSAAVSAVETPFAPSPTKSGGMRFGSVHAQPTFVFAPGWGRSTHEGRLELVGEGASRRLRFRAEYPAATNFTLTAVELGVPVGFRRLEIDGAERELPASFGGAMLGDGKESLAIFLADGTKVTFSGVRTHVEDLRAYSNSQYYNIRIYLKRTVEGENAVYTLDCPVSWERIPGTVSDFFRLPRGVPRFASAEFREGPDWVRSDFARHTEPGSPLDLSSLVDAPAGKHGFVRTGKDGRLEYERRPGEPVRFHGGNFSWNSTLLSKEEADRAAEEVVRLGYNLVRAHQHDTQFLPKGAKSSAEIDPAVMDRFDYFVAAMKRRGVSFTTDCYSSRKFLASDEGLGDLAGEYRLMKGALAVRPAALANWKAFTRAFLTHVNPYTGLALKDEPALVCLNLVNEDNLDAAVTKGSRFESELRAAFAAGPDLAGRDRSRAWRDFLGERQAAIHREMMDFVKGELGVKAPVTSLNMCSGVDYTRRREMFDLVDVHMYFAHPEYWNPTGEHYRHVFHSQLAGLGDGQGLSLLANFFQRDWRRPFVSTEYRHCPPNVFRSESGVLLGAYAALQGWDGLVGYGFAENAETLRGMRWNLNAFDTANDLFSQMMDRQLAFLYLRGDVSPARGRLALVVPPDAMKRDGYPLNLPRPVRSLGLFTGVGYSVGEAPAGVRGEPYASVTNAAARLGRGGVYTSDTRELVLDTSNRTFRAVTPRSEALLLSSGSLAGSFLRGVELLREGPCAVSVHALDGRPLAESRRMLVLHLTDSCNDGERFADGLMRRQLDAGKGGVLIRRQAVRAAFAAPGARLTALRSDGTPAGRVEASPDGSFTLDTGLFPGGTLAYLLER